ncbi:MAG TPA: ABC transporter substrate-binding protein [Dehalococcoidia bacterium]|nr:ABC transporter substrate-binding protein [Dehalococcoidia bacterium]HIK90188.1 ABC transporter substrate-binding protein [Dehalococcoidia bacterium]
MPEGPPHMDPHLTVSSGLLSWGAGQAYSRLFKFEVDADSQNTTVVCDLCSSWRQSDPLTFSIQIRTDVQWHNFPPLNGRPLTAQDVVFSLKRQASANYPNAALLSNIAEFTALGDHEVVIRLKSPDSETLEKLADSHSRIVAPEAVEVNGDLRRGPTVGTGPWMVSEAAGDVTRLIVNPDYYNDDLPYLDGLDIQVIPSVATRAAGMRTKVIDLAQVNFDDVASARERFEEIDWIGIENPAAGVEIMMNTTRSPMDKQAVRTAMMFTWDAGDAIPMIPGGGEMFERGNSLYGVSLGLPIINSDWLLSSSYYPPRFNKTSLANSSLVSAELKSTDNIIIKVGEYGQQYIDQANAMAEGLASVGIRAEVERISTRKFGDEVWIGGDYDIAVGSPPPISSTTGYLFSVHHSDGPWNTTVYSDPELDRLIEAQAQEYDSAKRGQLLLEIQHRILTGSHRFITSTRTTYWMFWDYVNEFNPFTPRGDTDFLTRVWMSSRES